MSEIPRGAIRFNTDSNKPELWDGSQWAEFQLSTPNLAESGDRQPGARGLFCGGYSPNASTRSDEIEYINISSTGNAQDFGDLFLVSTHTPLSNPHQLVPVLVEEILQVVILITIQFVTIASTGNATNFGDLTQIRRNSDGLSNQTRGLFVEDGNLHQIMMLLII